MPGRVGRSTLGCMARKGDARHVAEDVRRRQGRGFAHAGTISLGSISGIPVRADWSVLVIAWLIAWTLAVGVLPDLAENTSPVASWGVALVAAAVFLASLLAHEMSHSLVARRHGIRVESVTLWMLGGIARIQDEPRDARTQLLVAAAGPAASAAFGVAFLGLALVSSVLALPKVVVIAAAWLGSMNLLLGVFNLVPAAPLDGGRILQAVLWARRGDRLSASVSAARAGVVFAFVLIGLGLLEIAFGIVVGGVWFIFLGWFLLHAARSEEYMYRMRADLAGLHVADAMTSDPVVAPEGVFVEDLLTDYVLRHPASSFPLVDDRGGVTGLVTLRRVRHVPVHDRARVRALDIAWPLDELPRVSPGDLLLDALSSAGERGDGRLLVFEGGRLVGIVSPSDVSRLASRVELAAGKR